MTPVKLIPTDLLINEKVNAKLFKHRLQKLGIDVSLWEVFTLFEHLNTKIAKMNYPQKQITPAKITRLQIRLHIECDKVKTVAYLIYELI